MKMAAPWILLLLAPFISCANEKSNELPYIVEYAGSRTPCNEMQMFKWSSGFHNCFFDRKTKDGGQNLETIVDRILQHAEVCIGASAKKCLPDLEGFTKIMNITISQIKDYSEMYLSEIFKGKENFKDVECVEKTLSVGTYVKCFRALLLSPSVSQKSFEWTAKQGISCVNNANTGCSIEAKSSLNRLVGTIIGISSKELPPPTTTEAPTPPPPPPKRWYEYITQPFVSAWEAIKSFFGY